MCLGSLLQVVIRELRRDVFLSSITDEPISMDRV